MQRDDGGRAATGRIEIEKWQKYIQSRGRWVCDGLGSHDATHWSSSPEVLLLPSPRDFHTPQSSYTKEELLKSSEGGYFGPGNAQLPAPLMMDRITEISMEGGDYG